LYLPSKMCWKSSAGFSALFSAFPCGVKRRFLTPESCKRRAD
jgi:hypothetical protein